MKAGLKIFARIAGVGFMLLLFNGIYARFFYEKDLQVHSDVINVVRRVPMETQVLYVAESSNEAYREDDFDKRSISAMLGDYFPGLRVADLTKPAAHAGIYKALIRQIPDSSKIKTLVVTLNLRSFNAQWLFSELETPLQKSIVLLRSNPPLVNRFMLSFKDYEIKSADERTAQIRKYWSANKIRFPFPFPYTTVTEWDAATWQKGISDSLGHPDPKATELACHYVKGYAFLIDTTDHPRIRDVEDIIRMAKKRGWNLAFNLLAENTDKAEELVGKELIYLMDENRKRLIRFIESRGALVVDNLESVRDDQFIDANWTTEHYAEQGRRAIAQKVAERIRVFHPGQYSQVHIRKIFKSSYLNNCEEGVIWRQMHTLTEQFAHSGKHSSATGKGEDYSITFEFPYASLPDSLKGIVDMSCKVLVPGEGHKASLVIQGFRKGQEVLWKNFVLTVAPNPQQWQDMKQTFIVPDELLMMDFIKVYIYNPSGVQVFVDDFLVGFRKK